MSAKIFSQVRKHTKGVSHGKRQKEKMLPYDCHICRRCFIAVNADIVFIDVVSPNMGHPRRG